MALSIKRLRHPQKELDLGTATIKRHAPTGFGLVLPDGETRWVPSDRSAIHKINAWMRARVKPGQRVCVHIDRQYED